jgi:hypothetical protein
VPTAYEDQFFTIDPGNPPAVGTALTFARVEFIDEDDNGQILQNSGDTWDGNAITSVWPGDTITINVPGVGNITYTGVTFYFGGGLPSVFTPTDGQVLQNGTFVSSTFVTTSSQTPVGDFGPTCFTPGTMINTPHGPRPIENLRVGDLVETMDDGVQPIRLVLHDTFRAVGDLAPICFAPGAIGNKEPLIVSPQHRMLITGWKAELFFGQEEVLVAAKHLVNDHNVTRLFGGSVEYIHLLFDKHHIVFGGGVPSESYYPSHASTTQDQGTMDELLTLFPQLAAQIFEDCGTVRPVLRRVEAALLTA